MGSPRDRALTAALAFVAILIVFLAAPEDRHVGDPRPSTFLATDGGTKALYLMLEELHVPVGRGLDRWTKEVPAASALALIAPTIPPSADELDDLVAWIEAGGTLLYVASPGDPTLKALGLPAPVPAKEQGKGADSVDVAAATRATPEPHRWTAGVGVVHGFEWAFPDSAGVLRDSGTTPVLRLADGRITAAVLRRGEGSVIAWSDVVPLRNDALRTSGAALILARAAAEATAEGSPLVFDELHHGFRGDGHAAAATLRFLRDRPAGHMALQLLIVVIGLLLAAGWRFGAPLEPLPSTRRSPLEHVDALAALYQQANARNTTRRLLLAQLARRLGRRLPTEPGTSTPDPLDPILAGLRADRATIEAVRTEWRRGRRADLPALTKAMDRLVNEVKKT